ncbi:hypothetical protein ACFVYE_37160 [Streptomyces sp. NPDC058239]|uniref:hypothetical protein n=1 Tax=Streptomyces sp. NPDC058239 TaxID=3346395 RepID=UPI0036E08BDA
MYEFEPASPTYAISDTVVEHTMRGRDRSSADLPGGYRLTLRTRELHGPVRAALAAPSPTGNARICTVRFSPVTPMPAMTRVLDAVTRYAPALPDARDAHPSPQAVARLLTTGTSFQRPGEPGLFVRFGPAEAWLNGKRLSVTLGSPASGISLILEGPWDAPSTARLTAAVLGELTDAEQLAGEVAALLPPGPWRVVSDQYHPDAALILTSSRRPDPEDPLGRSVSRALRDVGNDLQAARSDWDFQELISIEGSAVALRITRRERAVARLVRTCVSTSVPGADEVGNTRTTFAPADPPTAPDRPPSGSPHNASGLALYVAAEDEPYQYGVKLDLGEWGYVLAAQSVLYGPGWYPFHKHVTRREKDPAYPLNDREVPTGRTIPAPVRISPDVENFSWSNEYVQLTPVDHRVEARLRLYVGERQARTLVRTVTLEIDLRARRVTLPDRIPAALRHQAETKGRRILDLLLAARRERRRGATEPWSVLEPWGRGDPPSPGT